MFAGKLNLILLYFYFSHQLLTSFAACLISCAFGLSLDSSTLPLYSMGKRNWLHLVLHNYDYDCSSMMFFWILLLISSIQKDFGIDIREEKETVHSADIFSKLKIEKDKVTTKPLIERKLNNILIPVK
jgi:hypothetical protein